MAKVGDVKNAVATQPPQQTLQTLIEKSAKELGKALPEHMRPERLVRIALTCIRQNPELAQCTPASFMGALFVAAQLGLEPIGGMAYILPFFNSRTGKKDAQFLVGYKGLANLFYRHEKAVQLNWGVVHENDEFDYEYGTQARLRHKPALVNRGVVKGFYVIAEVQGGAKPFMYMSREECIEHGKKHSKTFDKKTEQFYSASPWATNPDAMCLKTVLIQLAKLLPLSIELQRAISVDETSREYRSGIDDAIDLPSTTDWTEPEPSMLAPATTAPEAKPVGEKPTTEPDKGIVVEGTMTAAQEVALRKLAQKVYVDKWQEKLLNLIGTEYGLTTLSELSTEQAGKLITKLGREKPDAE